MGFLASKDVIECSATDLVGQYVGHTGPKTKDKFEKALGKVLFIDEAYRLSEGHFAKEAMDEIVGLMTNERYMNKLVIILAGYDHQMNELLGVNPGLASRFSEEIIFENMTSGQCLELLDKDLRKNNVVVPELRYKTSEAYFEMQDVIEDMIALPSWGNARDVKNLGKRLTQQGFANLADGAASESLSAEEVLGVMKVMLQEQVARQNIGRKPPSFPPQMPMATQDRSAPPPPSISTSTSHATKSAPQPLKQRKPRSKRPKQPPPAQASTEAQPPVLPATQRDPGVSDTVWNQLQADIAAREEAKRRAAEEEQRIQQEVEEAEMKTQIEHTRKLALERALAAAMENVEKQREAERQRAIELQRQLEEARRREAEVRAARERAAAELKRKQLEEAERQKQEAVVQQKLRNIGICPAGFEWIKQTGGYRCAGGTHFVTDAQLGL